LGSTAYKSQTIKRSINPTWNETFTFRVANPAQERLTIQVYDWDRFTRDDPIGYCQISVNDLVRGIPTMRTMQLQNARCGTLSVELTALDFGVMKGMTPGQQPMQPAYTPGSFMNNPNQQQPNYMGGYGANPPPMNYPQQPPMQQGYGMNQLPYPPIGGTPQQYGQSMPQMGYPQQPPMQQQYPPQQNYPAQQGYGMPPSNPMRTPQFPTPQQGAPPPNYRPY
jgi:hypothetical protein